LKSALVPGLIIEQTGDEMNVSPCPHAYDLVHQGVKISRFEIPVTVN